MRYKCPNHPDKELFISYHHLQRDHGCRYCAIENRAGQRRMTNDEFIKILYEKNPNIQSLEKYINSETPIKLQCKIDSHIWKAAPRDLIYNKPTGCPCCSNKTVVKGINDIATTHPYIKDWFVDRELAYQLTYGSKKKVKLQCPDCNYSFEKSPNEIFRKERNFICSNCKGSISYAERFIFWTLKSLNVNFNSRCNFSWSQDKEYDIYIPDNNIIIELHGIQHYTEDGFSCVGGRTLLEEQENDILKQNLAIQNGIENYIVIDARYSNADFIITNILESKLIDFYNFFDIDWLYIKDQSIKSFVKLASDLWNQGLRSKDIQEALNLSESTVSKYLKQAADANLCDYTPKRAQNRSSGLMCVCINTKIIFESCAEGAKYYSGSPGGVNKCCKGKYKTSGKHLQTGERLIWEFYNPEKHNTDDYIFYKE